MEEGKGGEMRTSVSVNNKSKLTRENEEVHRTRIKKLNEHLLHIFITRQARLCIGRHLVQGNGQKGSHES